MRTGYSLWRNFDSLAMKFLNEWSRSPFWGEDFPRNQLLNQIKEISLNSDSFQIELAIPGRKRDQIDVKVENGYLIVSSEAQKESDSLWQRDEYHYVYSLPSGVKEEEIKASYVDGILKISAPRKVEQLSPPTAKQITVE